MKQRQQKKTLETGCRAKEPWKVAGYQQGAARPWFILAIVILLMTLTACSLKPLHDEKVPLSGTEQAAVQGNVQGKLEVHYIDVGQGASQLILYKEDGRAVTQAMLIDAGNNDDEERVVVYLKNEGVKYLDVLVVTHPDADHSGGADAVVDAFEIGKIYMPKISANTKTFESLLDSIAAKDLTIHTAKAGVKLTLTDELNVQMVAPVQTYRDTNEMSAVIRLTYGQTSFLFTGDAEAESERDMLLSGVPLQADVLLVGHHGSASSTSSEFLKVVQPRYAIIQVGDNSYGHPTDDVLKRLAERDVKLYRNDHSGNIVVSSDGETIQVR